MQNITFLALNILSLYSMSPLYSINQKSTKLSATILNSHFSRFYSNIVFSNTRFQSTTINNNIFMHTLRTPLVFHEQEYYEGNCDKDHKCCVSKDFNFTIGSTISGQNISKNNFPTDLESKHPFFTNDNCGDLKITKCNFFNCVETGDYGGGISISANLEVILHHCTFDECNSKMHGCGGAIGGSFGFDYGLQKPTFGNAKRLDVQYTCFSNCFPDTDNVAFGTALLMAAQDVILYYASTVNCPKEKKAYGAQFDIQANNSISSQYVNATGGKSRYCGAIEYRDSKSGFFRYQTLMKMECKYVTSFTSVDINNIQIFSCNINDNTVSFPSGGSDASNRPSLIFVRKKKLTVTNFFFFNNTFNDDGLFTEKDHTYDPENINITLIDCYADVNDTELWDRDYIIINECVFEFPMAKTFALRQLQLGHCQGEIPPGPMIITPLFTASSPFSRSSYFSKSNDFTETQKFSKTDEFSSTGAFSESAKFSKSGLFSNSKAFSQSEKFSTSDPFTKTRGFTHTTEFTETRGFTHTTEFTDSKEFTNSGAFTITKEFTNSLNFNQTSYFTASNTFTPSKKFTKSDFFSRSQDFSDSNDFSQSDKFSHSNFFSNSDEFSKSTAFSSSVFFSKSDGFSNSVKFTKSDDFSRSFYFTKSSDFSHSNFFSKSDKFSQSTNFSSSFVFTPSGSFTSFNSFTASDSFTPSSSFTQSDKFTKSDVFSNSQNFTQSAELLIDKGANVANNNKIGGGAIAGIVVGVIAAVGAIIAAAVFFWIKKHPKFDVDSVDMMNETNSSITVDNNLNTVMDEDDPFAADFNNELADLK